MSQWRKCPITGRWVIIAPERAARPDEFRPFSEGAAAADPLADRIAACPFCEGHEADTPGEVAALRATGTRADEPGWQVRVIPNKYPALAPDGGVWTPQAAYYETQPALGAHEVIVESPRHVTSSGALSEGETAAVLGMYRDRLAYYAKASDWAYGLAFKNVGRDAGASMSHLHGQLVVLPMTPEVIQAEINAAADYARRCDACVFCDMIAQEEGAEVRVAATTAGFIAVCPFASRFAWETWILPRTHRVQFAELDDDSLAELADLLRTVLSRLESKLHPPAYNWIVHTAPFDTIGAEHYHWHIEILPRHTTAAGLEWGSGVHINATPPEDAASLLRIA